jgi:CheY-specific phosphatase CheX
MQNTSMYKIGIVTKTLSFYKKLSDQKKSDHKFELELVKGLDSLQQLENRGKVISSFIFDSTHSSAEIIELGQYINKSRKFNEAAIFLAFDDFQTFQTVTTHETFSNAKIINMPASSEDIYKKLISDTLGIVEEVKIPEATVKAKSSNVNSAAFLNAFIEATKATLEEMSSCSVSHHSTPEIFHQSKIPEKIAIRGKLAIKSPQFTGSFFICFPESTYLKVSSKILYEEIKAITKDNEDLVSEICNIVYGKSKVIVAGLNMKLDMVIPTYNSWSGSIRI